MKEISLTQGQIALVDDEDFEELNQWKWHARKIGKMFYAGRQLPSINKKRMLIHIHHEIIGRPPKGFETDHRDGNGLNNQRHNLRHVTHRQNTQNKKNGHKKSSKYSGVFWDKTREKWSTAITINGRIKHLGLFISELDAYKAYKIAVESLGETVLGNY